MTGAPPAVDLTTEHMLDLIGELRGSEVEKTLCGRRLLAWIEDHR